MVLHRMKLDDADPMDLTTDDANVDDLGNEDLKAEYAALLQPRLLPIVTLGSSHTSLPDKLSALLHALKLETGDQLQLYLNSVAACASDQGSFAFALESPAASVVAATTLCQLSQSQDTSRHASCDRFSGVEFGLADAPDINMDQWMEDEAAACNTLPAPPGPLQNSPRRKLLQLGQASSLV